MAIAVQIEVLQLVEILWLDAIVGRGHETDQPQWNAEVHLTLDALFDVFCDRELVSGF